MPDRSHTNTSAEGGAVQRSGGGIPPWVNKTMRFILRSPLHGLVSKNLMLITFTGRKSGQAFTTPVSYVRDGDTVTLVKTFDPDGRPDPGEVARGAQDAVMIRVHLT